MFIKSWQVGNKAILPPGLDHVEKLKIKWIVFHSFAYDKFNSVCHHATCQDESLYETRKTLVGPILETVCTFGPSLVETVA
ncbi:hypothetical protein Ancab_037633, partial [Ancistrocladus abbreviatus]